MKLEVLPLNQHTFSDYGDVIETYKRDFFISMMGSLSDITTANVEVLEQDRTLISINRAQPATMPIVVHELERHPLGTQAFMPMNGEVFVVIVALGEDKPDLSTLQAFITNGQQGVNYHRNVWHHPLFARQTVTNFLTVDRGGSDNCDVESIPAHELCFA